LREFIKFAFFGLLNSLVNYACFFILLKIGVFYIFASTFGFFSGAITGYYLNRRYTFKSQIIFTKGLYKYLSIQLFMLIINIIALFYLVEYIGFEAMIGQFFAIIITALLNFLFVRRFVFKNESNSTY